MLIRHAVIACRRMLLSARHNKRH